MTWRLLRAHVAAHAGSLAAVTALVLMISTLAGLMPRATTHVLTEGLRDQIAGLDAVERDLTARTQGSPSPGAAADPDGNSLSDASDPVWGAFDDSLVTMRESMPEPMRSVFGPASFAAVMPAAPAFPLDPDIATRANAMLSFGFDPRQDDHITITEGRAPRPVAQPVPSADTTVEFALSTTVAETMGWPVGQERVLQPLGLPEISVRLTGTYEAKDPDDALWTQIAATLNPSVIATEGAKPTVTGVGWVEPGSYRQILPISDGTEVRTWFPLRPQALTSRNSARFAAQVRTFTSQRQSVAGDEFLAGWDDSVTLFGITELKLSSSSISAIHEADLAGSLALAMVAMFASGPAGVALAVLALAAGMVIRRQRAAFDLGLARGASERQVRTLLALEGLAVGLPTGALGAVIAALVLPHDGTGSAWIWPVAVGLLAAVLFVAAPSMIGRTERAGGTRDDLTARDERSWRWTLEILVVFAAVAAIVSLRSRGLTASSAEHSADRSVDPLLAATPLLLSLAACLIVMRIYPWALRRVLARAALRRGPIALVGTARALRDPAAGLIAVLAMVTTVGIAVFSGVALTTLRDGLADSARAGVGSDLVIDGSPVLDELAAELSARSDVDGVATVSELPRLRLTADGEKPRYTTLVLVDVTALREVQQNVPEALTLPDALDHATGEALPVLMSEDLGRGTGLELGGDPLEAVGTVPSSSPVTTRSSWILADRQTAKDVLGLTGVPQRLLVDTDGAAAQTVREVARATPGVTRADTPADAERQLEHASLIPTVRHTAQLALAALAVLCAAVIALTLARGDAGRARQSALLGAMGETSRHTRRIVAWEIGPLAVVSLAAGLVIGLALPAVVLSGIDLTAFTAGAAQPSISVDVLLTAAIAGGVLLVVAIGTAVAALITPRLDLSATLRKMED